VLYLLEPEAVAGGCDGVTHANISPAGPAPTTRTSVVSTGSGRGGRSGYSLLTPGDISDAVRFILRGAAVVLDRICTERLATATLMQARTVQLVRFKRCSLGVQL
jgi:hypothetical protein